MGAHLNRHLMYNVYLLYEIMNIYNMLFNNL